MKKIIYTVSFVILSSILCPAQNEYNKAIDLIKNKEYDNALLLARDMLGKDSIDTAIKILLNLREADSNDKLVYDLLGDAYLKSGVTDLAISNYRDEITLDSTNTDIRFKLAAVYYSDKRYTDAVNEYLKIISINPENKLALFSTGKIFYLGKLYNDAITYLNKYLQLEPDNIEANNYFVNSYLKIQQYEKACTAVLNALKYDPSNEQLLRLAANSFYLNKNYDTSLKYYSELPDSEFSFEDFLNAGYSAQFIKKDTLAVNYLLKAFDADSGKSSITMEIGNLYYSIQNYEKAAEFYKKKIDSDRTFEPAYRFIAFSYLQLKNYPLVVGNLKEAISLNDTTVASYFWLGQTYRYLDSTNQAVKAFEDMFKVVGDREASYENEIAESSGYMGQVLFEQKKYNPSISYLTKALKYKPNNINWNLMLASAYYTNGDADSAVKYYKRVLVIDPKNEIAKKGLRLLSAD